MVAEAILAALAGKTLENALETLNDLRKEGRSDRVSIDDSQTRQCLISQVQSLESWSESITLLSLIRNKTLRDSFVELSLSTASLNGC